jgi:hypothetical protein
VPAIAWSALASALILAGSVPVQAHSSVSAIAPSTQAQKAAPPAQVNWQAATREDVLAAYDIFSQHHPGMFDRSNPGFPEQLRRARDAALAFGQNVHDPEGHMRALELFSSILADGHARVQAAYDGHGPTLWPGFRTVWRGEALRVLDSGDDGPPRGSALVACDGRNARGLIRDQVFPLFAGRPNEAGQWWVYAPQFFLRAPSSYETLPRSCTFESPGGQTKTYRLDWQPVPKATWKEWFKIESRRAPVGLSETRKGIVQITLTTFSPDENGRAQYAQLFHDIDGSIDRIATARALVIDLRHNQGGSSSWSEEVANHLWGKDAVDAAMAKYFRNTQVWWLADPANAAYFRTTAARLRGEGSPEIADDFEAAARHLAAAIQEGKRFYVEDYGTNPDGNPQPRKLPPIYVITDGGCVSACLDALDVFTRFPGVKLVGAPTSADSNYLEIRYEPLPSERGIIILPTKIWVHRPRGSGEVYRPDIAVNDLDWTTETILDHIDRDLTAK